MTVPDGETTTFRESPKMTLGKVKLQDREFGPAIVCASEASLPFTDQTALTFTEKTAVVGVDIPGTNAGFS